MIMAIAFVVTVCRGSIGTCSGRRGTIGVHTFHVSGITGGIGFTTVAT